MKIEEKTYNEYWAYYWRIISRHKIPHISQWDQNLVNLVEAECSLSPGMKLLDLGCAGGDQAILFAKKGYQIVGIDKVDSLIKYARKKFASCGLKAKFSVADMRSIYFENEFDLCTLFSGTFGFFTEKGNNDLLKRIKRSLKPGGYVFLDYLPLEKMSRIQFTRKWNPIEGGYALCEEWFDTPTATYRTTNFHIMLDGRIIKPVVESEYHANEIIRCYGAKEMECLSQSIGFKVIKHLSRNHINDRNYQPNTSEPRGMIILQKTP